MEAILMKVTPDNKKYHGCYVANLVYEFNN
jgi:hypothetical protein